MFIKGLSGEFRRLSLLKFTNSPPYSPKTYTGRAVINVSSKTQTTGENQILSRGLKFAITPSRISYSEIIVNAESAIYDTRSLW